MFWIDGRLWKAVAYKRWSHMEVQLNFTLLPNLQVCTIRTAVFCVRI